MALPDTRPRMFLRMRDHNPSDSRPFITYTPIALIVLIFLSYRNAFWNKEALLPFYDKRAMFPERVHYRRDLYSLTSSMFLHVSRMHLLGNMLILNIFVDNLEDETGHC